MAQSLKPQANLLYGTPGPLTPAAAPPIVAQRAPVATDTGYPIGQIWIDVPSADAYILNGVGAGVATWSLMASTSGDVGSLTGDTGTAVPTAGNIQIAGTANQITTAASGSTVTVSIPSTLSITNLTAAGTVNLNATGAGVTTIGTGGTGAVNIGNATGNTAVTGSLTATTTLTATLGDVTATNGDLVLGTAGNKLSIATGADASVGTSAAMTAGTITVATTAVTASSIIFLTTNTIGGTAGTLSAPVASIVAGTSFDIVSSSNTDTSTVNWWIVN